MNETKNLWDSHYLKQKSKLSFPDENLVRMLAKLPKKENAIALDFGTGSGRHIPLLEFFEFSTEACDYSKTAIEEIQETFPKTKSHLISDTPYSELKSESYDVIVSWGVMHYNSFPVAQKMMEETFRILKKDGYLLGSIRKDTDTHLGIQKGKEITLEDLKGGYAELYSKEKLLELLSPFSEIALGFSERTPLGKLEQRISHWFFQAKKL